jgi:DNA-directed RNA polymerase subunit RPC12/RpoP
MGWPHSIACLLMSNVKTPLARGIRAAKSAMGPQKYQAAGKSIACSHCGGDRFTTPNMPTILGYIFDCAHCKQRLLFAEKPEWLKDANA